MSEYRTAQIFVRGELAGLLRETDEDYSFSCDTEYMLSENTFHVSIRQAGQRYEFINSKAE